MNNLYQALSGGQPPQLQQPSAPLPPGSPGIGSGSPQMDPSLFEALQQAQIQGQPMPGMQPGIPGATQPLELGPQVANANETAQGFVDFLNKGKRPSPTPTPTPKK